MSIASPSGTINDRAGMIREAFRLEYVTLAWMAVEAGVAIGSGVAAGSLTLTAFGIDSLIELASVSSSDTAKPSPRRRRERPRASAGLCCSRSPPTLS